MAEHFLQVVVVVEYLLWVVEHFLWVVEHFLEVVVVDDHLLWVVVVEDHVLWVAVVEDHVLQVVHFLQEVVEEHFWGTNWVAMLNFLGPYKHDVDSFHQRT